MKYKINFNDSESSVISTDILDKLDISKLANNQYHLLDNNKAYDIHLESIDLKNKSLVFFINDVRYEASIENELDLLVSSMGFDTTDDKLDNEILSPMPGVILDVLVKQGQKVEKGDQLLVLEAMKMENMLKAGGDGVIDEIHIKIGDAVEKNQLLISFEE